MKEKLINYFKEKKCKALKRKEIIEKFDLLESQFNSLIQELLHEGIVVYETNKKYYGTNSLDLFKAKIVRVKERFCFAYCYEMDTDIYIDARQMVQALLNDLVLLYIEPGSTKGEVVEILERGNKEIVGTIKKHRLWGYYAQPDSEELDIKVFLNEESLHGAVEGHKVVVQNLDYGEEEIIGEVKEILGHYNDPGVDILSLVHKHQARYEFPSEVMTSLDSIPNDVSEQECVGRYDARNQLVVTIDGEDAKDLDDAITLTMNEDGTYKLGVYIADVSHYVDEGCPLDKEAFLRGTSIYLADRVIPMLPHKLSNGICSLNPNVNRLTLCCIMDVNHQGEVVNYSIEEAIIASKFRLTYQAVNELFDEGKSINKEVDAMLLKMKELADIVRKEREGRGALDLDVAEGKVIVNEFGKAIDVIKRTRGDAEMLIEDFMILANETTAKHIYWQELPFIYRVHDQPKLKKLELLKGLVATLGFKIKGDANGIHPKELQSLLNRSQDSPYHDVIATLMLRSLAKAVYSADNIGHFGLGSSCYTHFTSPIRRYPDLMVHRLLKLYNKEGYYLKNVAAQLEKVVYIAESTSLSERKAVELEREVTDMKKAEYMLDKIGEKFEGIVSGFIESGMFIELDNTVEGLVRFDEMEDDYYNYIAASMMAVGEATKKRISLGDRVKVKVVSVEKAKGQINFLFLQNLTRTKKEMKKNS